MIVTSLVVACFARAQLVHGVVVGSDGKPTQAVIGTSLLISNKRPAIQVGYGKPGIATDQAGRFLIDGNELYSHRIVAVDGSGNIGFASVINGSSVLKITLHPPRSVTINLTKPSPVTDSVCSLDFESQGGVIGYAVGTWGNQTFQIPSGPLEVMVSNAQCRLTTVKAGRSDLVSIRLKPTAWAQGIGKLAPEITPTSISNYAGIFDLKSLRGKWVLVDFWAVWCQPCVVELDSIANFYREHQGQRDKFEILGVHSPDGRSLKSLRESLDRLEKDYWHGKPLPFPLIFDQTGSTVSAWGVQSYPTTLLIDPEGRLVGPATVKQLQRAIEGAKPDRQRR
jgi:thiol-disulfide isomerase/thioredoxin